MSSTFGDETLHLPQSASGGWLDGYASALRTTSMGAVSQEVVLEDSRFIADRAVLPADDPEWTPSRVRTGAVMGAVQSGKTASMIGVLARALDTGVNVAVVLAGTQTSLWLQTLGRIREQLDSGPNPLRRRIFLPNPGEISATHRPGPNRAYALSARQAERALKLGRPIIVVAMKQVDHLLHLGQTLRNVVFPAAAVAGVPARLLVIDDEADDSSIADDDLPWESPELEVFKQVPRRIVDLWESRSNPGRTVADHVYATYIAYTATPQANFLQDPQNPLAPRDFVASLRTPGESGDTEPRSLTYRVPEGLRGWYTGSDLYYGDLEQIFCITDSSEPDRETNLDEQSPGDNESPQPAELEGLVDPVRAYLVATAIRLSRTPDRLGPAAAAMQSFENSEAALEHVSPVTSMLIHPSSAKDIHFEVADLLRTWWNGDGTAPGAGVLADLEQAEHAWVNWVDSYNTSAGAVADRYEKLDPEPPSRLVPSWAHLRDLLVTEVVPGTTIAVINSDPEADDRPQFLPWRSETGWHAPPNHSTIFVAGNVMSRGLTLEGLLTTLFTRSSAAPLADTQMQMQRWFGYRGAYIDLCRVFLSAEQLSLFSQYADADHALRSQLLAAMETSANTLPDFSVLQGPSFQATGKVSGLSARQLRPGPRPLVRHLNPPEHEDHNLDAVRAYFTEAHERDALVVDRRGLVTVDSLNLLETADLLDQLQYVHHGSVAAERRRWEALERQAGIRPGDPEFPLYRAPEIAKDSLDLGSRSPYAIAAYLRFWAACLDRHVRGLMTDDDPPQRWNLLNLDAKKRAQPTFRVGLRFGSGAPLSGGPVADLGHLLEIPVRPMARKLMDGALAADWGSRKATEGGFAGDDLFDYVLLGEAPDVHADGTRREGALGLVLFQLVQRAEDPHGAVSVGLSIPSGGPDHIEAVNVARLKFAS